MQRFSRIEGVAERMLPIDVLTEHTAEFVRDALPGGGLRLLEVGAGGGHLARALMDAGHTVVAIDTSEDAVARARQLGVDARHADWHGFEDGRFDTIVFTRSLHHIERLPQAVDRCWPMLGPGGRVILEEFSVTEVDALTAEWLQSTLLALRETGAIELPQRSFLNEIVDAEDPHAWWHEHHGHLHKAADITAALQRRGRIVEQHTASYLYRYFLGAADTDDRGGALVHELKRTEEDLIDAGLIRAVGLRFVAEPR